MILTGLLDNFPNLDDKTFAELVSEARSLIPLYAPLWTDHNIHDPGITFIDLFAWLVEMQIYHLNRVTDANYIKFLKLIGLYPRDAIPARVDITFENVTSKTIVEKDTQIIIEAGSEKIVFITEEDFMLVPAKIQSVKTTFDSRIIDNTDANEKEDIYFAAFGENASAGAALELGLKFDKDPVQGKDIHIMIYLFEDDIQPVGNHIDEPPFVVRSVSVIWEYWRNGTWNELPVKKDTTQALTGSGRIVFAWLTMDKRDNCYWIRCRLKEGKYEVVPLVNTVLLNTISAVQIETREDSDYGMGIPGQKIQLSKPALKDSLLIREKEPEMTSQETARTEKQLIEQKRDSKTSETAENKSQTTDLSVQGESGDWIEVDDFDLSGPGDQHYIFNAEKGEITFGNGLNGKIPPEFRTINARYSTTAGSKGNIPKGQKWGINKDGFGTIKRTNKKAAYGGMDAESINDAKARAKKYFRDIYRAITTNDFEELALYTPGIRVARAKAIPNYNPEYPCINVPGAVTVVAVPYTRKGNVIPHASEGFLQTVLKHLENHRLITAEVYVIGPEYFKISVTCKVRALKKSSPAEVEKRVKDILTEFIDPLKWQFGRAVYPSEIYQIIDGADGVDYAAEVYFRSEGKRYSIPAQKDVLIIPPFGLVYSGEHHVEII